MYKINPRNMQSRSEFVKVAATVAAIEGSREVSTEGPHNDQRFMHWSKKLPDDGEYNIFIDLTVYLNGEAEFELQLLDTTDDNWQSRWTRLKIRMTGPDAEFRATQEIWDGAKCVHVCPSYDGDSEFLCWHSANQGDAKHPLITKYRPELGRLVKIFAESIGSPLVERTSKNKIYSLQLLEAAEWLTNGFQAIVIKIKYQIGAQKNNIFLKLLKKFNSFIFS